MKRTFALLLTALLALSLTGCGSNKDNNAGSTTPDNSVNDSGTGSNTATGSGSNTATGTGLTKSADGRRVDNGATGTTANAADNSMLGLENDGAGAPQSAVLKDGTNATAATQNGTTNNVIRGATYGQMLRNARVHDRDGYLLDGENAVTPGAAYR